MMCHCICSPAQALAFSPNTNSEVSPMAKILFALALLCFGLWSPVTVLANVTEANDDDHPAASAKPINPVIEWNRTLLSIVRTPGAQPATIHSTRNFAILHAAIYDAVDNIEGGFTPYLVRLPDVSHRASQPAAADQAAHDVLVNLYPAFKSMLDAELQADLALIPDGNDKADGIAVGQAVAAQILAVRSNDGSGVTPPPY